ncbi:MAG: hypothetical protein H6733_02860 [Alphaproteobacteria bacterium]|nr:hypothetical protein [Alphaproteobacteria bacterium]
MAPDEAAQARERLDTVAAAIAVGGIDAMTLAASDWAMSPPRLAALAQRHELPILAANLVCDGRAPYPASTVVTRGGHTVGIVGVTDGPVSGCEVGDPAASLQAAIGALPPVDAVIALVPLPERQLSRVLSEVQGITVAFDATGTRQGDIADRIGNTWVVGSGMKGATLGTTTLAFREPGGAWAPEGYELHLTQELERARRRVDVITERLENDRAAGKDVSRNEKLLASSRTELADLEAAVAKPAHGGNLITTAHIKLDDTVGEHAATQAIVGGTLTKEQAAAPAVTQKVPHKTLGGGTPYAGSDRCKVCHVDIGAQWEGTAHARAWQTLVDDDHAADVACFSCHSTGAGQPGGPQNPAQVRGLRDVQCEACHGPGLTHVARPKDSPLPVPKPDQAACSGCHESERAMGRFDYATYLPQVMHKATGTRDIP